jgi:hypothetical protein
MIGQRARRVVLISAVGAFAMVASAGPVLAAPGSQGTDTAIPLTSSAASASGRGEFAGLRVTVNQTKSLTNQAVSVTWTGGVPTVASTSRFAENYLQIMQCWGDDDGTVPENPGPSPENCVFGALQRSGAFLPEGEASLRVISRSFDATFDPSIGALDRAGKVWRAFVPADGRPAVGVHTDYDCLPSVTSCSTWVNGYFNTITTNEIVGSRTFADGTGAELFEVHTALESSGLGCGLPVQATADGGKKEPQCWLVVVPRGSTEVENEGTVYEQRLVNVSTSPLAPSAWANRIAIPLDFISLESPCSINDSARRIAGTDMGVTAVAAWQPALCQGEGLPPFTYSSISDDTARQQLARGTTGMIAVGRPYASQAGLDPTNPIVFSPLAVSGLTIGFTYERNTRAEPTPEEVALATVRLADLNLTPRLVAKLLSQSYSGQVPANQRPEGFDWMASNPNTLANDQDFIRFNPEFESYRADTKEFGGLSLPSGNSDAAVTVWEWVLADPEAAAWLAGAPDEWGMRVNPWYSTDAAVNPGPEPFALTVPNSFPKGDPYCYQAPSFLTSKEIVPPLLCYQDWSPYARNLAETARVARVAFDGAKTNINPFAEERTQAWASDVPQDPGVRAVLSLTDTPSATKFGLQQSRLSRAGDNGAERTFIDPNTASMTAGVQAMKDRDGTGILQPDQTAASPGAYPLTMLTYAAYAPLSLTAGERADYAGFLEFSAGKGQIPGFERGQLPAGYVPLTTELQAEAFLGASLMRTLVEVAEDPIPSTTATTATTAPATTIVTSFESGGSTSAQSPPPQQFNTPSLSQSPPFPQAPAAATPTDPADVVDSVVDGETSDVVDNGDTVGSPGPAASATVIKRREIRTPEIGTGVNRLAFPIAGFIAAIGVLVAYEITKRPRRLTEVPR